MRTLLAAALIVVSALSCSSSDKSPDPGLKGESPFNRGPKLTPPVLTTPTAGAFTGAPSDATLPGPNSGSGAGSGFAPTTDESFTRDQIVFPEGEAVVREFLGLALRSPEKELQEVFAAEPLIRVIPEEGSAVFTVNDRNYMLYHQDLNHDGKKEYLVIFLMDGPDQRNGIEGVYVRKGKGIVRMKKNAWDGLLLLTRSGYQLSVPFVVRMGDSNFLRFIDGRGVGHTYLWKKNQLSEAHF